MAKDMKRAYIDPANSVKLLKSTPECLMANGPRSFQAAHDVLGRNPVF